MEKTSKAGFILALTVLLAFSSLAFAVTNLVATINVNFNVPETASVQVWLNNTLIESETYDFNLGDVSVNTDYSFPLNVYNDGNVAVEVFVNVDNVPPETTVSWNINGTEIQPQNWVNGTLTISFGSVSANSYSMQIHVKMQRVTV